MKLLIFCFLSPYLSQFMTVRQSSENPNFIWNVNTFPNKFCIEKHLIWFVHRLKMRNSNGKLSGIGEFTERRSKIVYHLSFHWCRNVALLFSLFQAEKFLSFRSRCLRWWFDQITLISYKNVQVSNTFLISKMIYWSYCFVLFSSQSNTKFQRSLSIHAV